CSTRTLRNFVQFSKYQLASSDATFYILLACLILVNKFSIFSFCLQLPFFTKALLACFEDIYYFTLFFLFRQLLPFNCLFCQTPGGVVKVVSFFVFQNPRALLEKLLFRKNCSDFMSFLG
ncbi:hypothetical protein, partial [Lactobacillus delbrueckii]|uniref:hypothetical protein n=2 Tax=Lactobacillus delbrueckii TaxID=1584 RepID=UPI0022A66473